MSFESIQNIPHPITEKYKLEFIGQGAENLVYSVRDRPTFVFKGNKLALAKALDWNASHGYAPEADTEGVEELRQDMLERQRKAYQTLKACFGDHVPAQRQYVMSVPYNTSVLEELQAIAHAYDLKIPTSGEGKSWTIVTAQEKIDEMSDFRRVSLRWSPVKEEQPLSTMIAEARELRSEMPHEKVRQRFSGSSLERIFQRIDEDPRFAEAVADFQRHAVQYANAAQTILDLVGNDNVLFTKQSDGSWNYVLVDALFPFGDRILERAKEALLHDINKLPQKDEDREAVVQAMSFARTINALGAYLHTGESIDVLPPNPVVPAPSKEAPLKTASQPVSAPRLQPLQTKTGLFAPIKDFDRRKKP